MKPLFAEDRLPAGTMCATIGLFDGVHLGHCHTLNMVRLQAAACGLKPMVVTFDQHPQHILHPEQEPVLQIMTAVDRMSWLESAGIDNVLVLEFTKQLAALPSTEFMRLLHDNYGVARLVVGYDNRFGSDTGSTIDDYRRTGAAIGVTVLQGKPDPHAPVSSSLIREAVRRGDVRRAELLLGRSFYISGKVVHGNRVGSSIGFPTANVGELPTYQLMPAPGAYAVGVNVCGDNDDGIMLPGMAGVGHRPTINGGSNEVTVEVNMFGYDGGDLYGRDITVHFIDRLRDEVRFDSTEALRQQLARDRDAADRILEDYFTQPNQ